MGVALAACLSFGLPLAPAAAPRIGFACPSGSPAPVPPDVPAAVVPSHPRKRA